MRTTLRVEDIRTPELEKISEVADQNLYSCYQCGKCTAGCPVVSLMEIPPNEVIRLTQLGKLDRIFDANTIWVCAACLTCSVRCPRGVNIAETMEALRQLQLRKREFIRHIDISPEELAKLPTIALVSNYRKVAN